MRVQMNTKIGGFRDGVEWPAAGGVIDVPAHEAADLIANGYAKIEEDTDGEQTDPADLKDQAAIADSDEVAAVDSGDEADAGTEADPGVDTPAEVTPGKTRKRQA